MSDTTVKLDRELIDADGENLAVRTFLQLYGGTNSPSIEGMRDHLAMSGFDGCWPEWAATEFGFLTKGGAQDWLRHLFSLEADRNKRAVAAGQWQPIETAPKDGTPILVSNGESIAAVYWWPAVWMGTTHNGMKNPTHWMPPPELPVAAQGRKA